VEVAAITMMNMMDTAMAKTTSMGEARIMVVVVVVVMMMTMMEKNTVVVMASI
ncbi:hypothetical protein K7432_018187, partial [Basidiobolus ranarum]